MRTKVDTVGSGEARGETRMPLFQFGERPWRVFRCHLSILNKLMLDIQKAHSYTPVNGYLTDLLAGAVLLR